MHSNDRTTRTERQTDFSRPVCKVPVASLILAQVHNETVRCGIGIGRNAQPVEELSFVL